MRLDRNKLQNAHKKTYRRLPNSRKNSRNGSNSFKLFSAIFLILVIGLFFIGFSTIINSDNNTMKLFSFLKQADKTNSENVNEEKEIFLDLGQETRVTKVLKVNDEYLVVGDVLTNEKEKYQIFLAKLDKDGNIISKTFFGNDGDEFAYDIIKENDGYVVVGVSSSKSFGVRGRYDALVVRYNEQGKVLWYKVYGGPDWDRAYKVLKTENGYVTIGDNYAKGGDVSQNFGEHDYWIVNISKDGKIIWDRSFGGIRWDRAYSGGYLESQKLILSAGSSNSFTDGNRYDGYVVAYDTKGNLVWKSTLTNSYTLWPLDLVVTNNSIYVAGYVYERMPPNSNGNNSQNALGVEKGFIARLSESGQVVYLKMFGENARIHSIAVDSSTRDSNSENETVLFAGYKTDKNVKMPWYGSFIFQADMEKPAVIEKYLDTEYGMLFNILKSENGVVISGSIMKEGKIVGLLRIMPNI
ncbi:hypothetical protein [Fervidobacterium gondwanense]|uniref:hypothetical protein n=1 Tax=Fervidobacterium gondwanense TaxID=44754 RepID=UPI003C754A8C